MTKFINLIGKDSVTREKAKGYKALSVDAKTNDTVKIRTKDNDTLEIYKVEEEESDEFSYLILCNEFGLLGLDKDFKSKIDVMFLDDGYMLIELKKGHCVCMSDDGMQMFSTEEVVPQIKEHMNGSTNILWVDESYLLSYLTNENVTEKYLFVFDVIFSLVLGGTVVIKDSYSKGTEQFEINVDEDNTIDISLGYIAKYKE